MVIGTGLFLLVLSGHPTVFAQTDAERFAEGRIALDKYKDCRAAKDALESVSEAGRSESLWLLYTAKAYECLNDLDKALALYVKYNQVVGERADIIEKIGDLRYRSASKQRAEDDKRDAKARLDVVLQALRDQLNASWSRQPDERTNVEITTTVLSPLSCDFKFTFGWQERTVYNKPADGSPAPVAIRRWIESVSLDLIRVKGMYVERILPEWPQRLKLYGEKNSHMVGGTWEMTHQETGRESWSKRGSLLVPDFSIGWDWPSEDHYPLRFDQSRSKESIANLQRAFEAAVATCKTAQR